MKSIATLFFLFIVATTTLSAQEKLKGVLPVKNDKVTYTEIVQVDSLSKADIYKRARLWLAKNYENSKIDDQDLLISKGYFPYGPYKVWNTIVFRIKNGKYKFEISDFKLQENNTEWDLEGNYGSLTKKYDYTVINKHITDQIASFKKAIQTSLDSEENW